MISLFWQDINGDEKLSLWEKYNSQLTFKALNKDIEVDTLIIGGGITGLTTLYYLKNLESVCLVDASKLGNGVSKNTTGKLTYLQGAIYTKLKDNINENIATTYLKSQKYAIELIKEIIKEEKIDCNLEKVTSYIYAEDENDKNKLIKEKQFLEKNDVIVEDNSNISTNQAISVKDTYVFNPIKYLNGLKEILKDQQIYENTKIVNIEYKNQKYICHSLSANIIANKVIISCHYPFFLFPFLLPLKSHIEKSYLIAYKVKENKLCSGITLKNPGFSYRYYQDGNNIYKICLAASHNTAIKQNDLENFNHVKNLFNIPDGDIVASWSNMDVITDDYLPYIGEIKKNLYIATGFNTWGMTNGILASKIIADLITNKKNIYADLFKPNRNNFYKFKSFFENIGSTIIAFVGSKKKNKSWYKENLEVKKINGKSVGVYTDHLGKKHTVFTTCPHLKCSLIFNELEHTWDCPCHSSRFNLDGKCIKGPSKYDISFKE